VVAEEIITQKLSANYDGEKFDREDLLYIAVVERHGHNQAVSLGLVEGFGLKEGAIASSVAHDSHNIIVVGTTPEAMALAVNTLIDSAGGFVVTSKSSVLAQLALPLAGLISTDPAEQIYEKIKQLKGAAREIGCQLEEPFLQLSFLALPVIPALKITDRGLFDVTSFSYLE
jgi:adenine deaminase